MRNVFVFILLSILTCKVTAQTSSDQRLDSLRQRLTETSGEDYIRTLNKYGTALIYTSPALMDSVSNQALKMSKELNFDRGEMGALNNKGISSAMLGELDSAIYYFNQSLKLAQKLRDSSQIAALYDNIGNVYNYKSDYRTALEYQLKTLHIEERLGTPPADLASSKMNIAIVFNQIGDEKRAIKYYREALKSSNEAGDKSLSAKCYANLATAYRSADKNDSAKMLYEKGAALAKEVNNKNTLSACLQGLGSIYREEGNLEESLEYWNRVVEISNEIQSPNGLAVARINMGRVYMELGELEVARNSLLEGIAIARQNGYRTRQYQGYNTLAEVYHQLGNNNLAYVYKDSFSRLKDSILNERLTQQIEEMQALYEKEKDRRRIADLESQRKIEAAKARKQKELDAAEIERKQIIIVASIAGLTLAVLFGVFAFRAFMRKRKDNRILTHKNDEIRQQRNEITHQKNLIEEKNVEIMDSLNYAVRIQQAILPTDQDLEQLPGNSFVLYLPKDIVAGDFYWMESLTSDSNAGEGWLYIAAADCTGHGVPGAMVSVVCSNALSKALVEEGITEPGPLLDRTRELVIERFGKSEDQIKDGMDISLAAIRKDGKQVRWSGANNPLWVVKAEGQLHEVKPNKQPIGAYFNISPFQTHALDLEKGDQIYLFTDGYLDQFGGPKGKKMKTTRFREIILETSQLPIDRQKDELSTAFNQWKGDHDQLDDVCVLGIQV